MPAPSSLRYPPMNSKTILSYNLLEGLQNSELQMDVFVRWVQEIDPDIIFYQELNDLTEPTLRSMAERFGHPFAVRMKEPGYRVGISSKQEITDIQRFADETTLGYISARIGEYHVFAVHLDPFTDEARIQEIKSILQRADEIPPHENVIIAGDFNSFSALDRATYEVDPDGLMNSLHAVNPDWKLDFTVTNLMREAGFTDVYKQFNPEFQHTWPTPKRLIPGDRNWRIDYIFVNDVLKEKCQGGEIVQDRITKFLSDHYPLVVRLGD